MLDFSKVRIERDERPEFSRLHKQLTSALLSHDPEEQRRALSAFEDPCLLDGFTPEERHAIGTILGDIGSDLLYTRPRG